MEHTLEAEAVLCIQPDHSYLLKHYDLFEETEFATEKWYDMLVECLNTRIYPTNKYLLMEKY